MNDSRHHYRLLFFIKFILIIFIIICYTLSYIFFTKATFHLNKDRYISQSLQCPNINQTRVEYGRKHFSQSRVIICGLIRDREAHIKRLKEQLNIITKNFADYAIVIVENDSKDNTRRELINWAENDKHIHIIGCGNQTNNPHACNLSLAATKIRFIPETSRIEKMVRLRNIYMNYIDNHILLNKFDYVIVEDFDLTTYTYLNGLFSTGFYLNNNLTIDAICSNGIFYNTIFKNMISYETYFDPYAHKDQQNQNWSMAYNDLWSTLFRKYSCDDSLIHVQSCFSGRTIYRYQSIVGKRYRTYLDHNKQVICEHVGLHETLNNMYLNKFSSIDTFSSSTKTIEQYYKQRSNFIKQITIFQFGLAIFSKTSDQQKYHVDIYNFYLHPTSINPIDVKYLIQSSSIKFLSEYKFDFNKCFYSGISFLNQTQENILLNQNKSISNYRFSINDQNFLNILFEKINKWLIKAQIGDRMEYELNDRKEILSDYLLHMEIRRCFKTIWSNIHIIDKKKTLLIEHISKEIYEQRLKDNSENNQDLQLFIQSLIGFTKLIRYIKDNYRKPVVGHNCFLDWLLIYDKFLDILPSKFEQFQMLMNKNFVFSIFDTKYLALEMKQYLFTRQNRSEISNYIDNLTTATSLSSLYDLLTSKYYENLIFFKPIIELNPTDRYKHEKHEAGYDAYMSGVIFLKLIYLSKQKKVQKIEFNEHQSIFDICLNDIKIYKNRFYSTFTSYLSLNRFDNHRNLNKKYQQCLVLQKHDKQKIDMSDIISRFNSYCSMEYEINGNLNQIYLLFQSENCQRQILRDYLNDPLYKIEKFHWFKHSFIRTYSFGISIVMTGICIFLLLKHRM